MAMYAVLFTPSSRWMVGIPPTEQTCWKDHLMFMNGLVEQEIVHLGGVYAEFPKIFAIIEAEDENHVHAIFAADPFIQHDVTVIDQINEATLYVTSPVSLNIN